MSFRCLKVWATRLMAMLFLAFEAAAQTNPPIFAVDSLIGTNKLSGQQLAQLARDGFVILPREHRQIFDVYNFGGAPYYVTADSVIQAFSVVLEDCIRKRERVLAGDLMELLADRHDANEKVFAQLAARAEQNDADAKAFREALCFLSALVSVAGRLMDPAFPVNPEVRDVVDAELARVLEARGVAESPLSGRTVDYGVFSVSGSYGQSTISARFFRSVRFLQNARFHVESRKETLAALIGTVYGRFDNFSRNRSPNFNQFHVDVFGSEDDLEPGRYDYAAASVLGEAFWGVNLDKTDPVLLVRYVESVQAALRKLPDPRINDEVWAPAELENWPARAKALRLVCPAYLPDAELIFQSARPSESSPRFPSGLDVGVMLGSRRAAELLAAAESPAVVSHVQDWSGRVARNGTALYPRFLRILQDYREEMERNRDLQPAFGLPAWDDKTLNTLLCGWALIRHSAALSGKDSAHWSGLVNGGEFSGYVEPVPGFYLAMADLLGRYERILCRRETPSPRLRAMEIQDFARAVREAGTNSVATFVEQNTQFSDLASSLWRWGVRHEDDDDLTRYARVAERYLAGRPNTREQNEAISGQTVTNEDGSISTVYTSSDSAFEKSDEEILRKTLEPRDEGFAEYRQLIHLCIRLAAIAVKEVQGMPLDEEDAKFIKGYGGALGNVCFYAGNSYLSPRDDMPVAAPVFSDLQSHRALMVGIGRARCMKVVIRDPSSGQNMVCTGGITLYHEYPSAERMDDTRWRAALREPDGPKPAPWMGRYLTTGAPGDGK